MDNEMVVRAKELIVDVITSSTVDERTREVALLLEAAIDEIYENKNSVASAATHSHSSCGDGGESL